MKNIITVTRADDTFTTLMRALTAAGIIDTLSGSGPFTLFAPTNLAFSQLPADTIDRLLTRDARADLTTLMTFHIVAGKVLKPALRNGQTIQTVQGQLLSISVDQNSLLVNGVTILAMTEAANGFIYAIDTVLMPAPTL